MSGRRHHPTFIPPDGVRTAHDRDATWIVIVSGILAIATLAFVIAVGWPEDDKRPPSAGAMFPVPPPVLFPQPSPPVSVRPTSGSGSLSVGPSTLPVVGRSASRPVDGAVDSPVHRPTGQPPASPSRTPAGNPWAAGRVVSLQPVRLTGFVVRHRDFRARVDRLNGASSGRDRADATYRIRPGLASAACVSFESVNFPGRYLRHQNFSLFLHPRANGDLFAADATFCPAPATPGGPAALRSLNYPGRFVVVRNSLLYLDPVAPAAATLFAAGQPL